jgi:hypothetical protein
LKAGNASSGSHSPRKPYLQIVYQKMLAHRNEQGLSVIKDRRAEAIFAEK